MIMNEWKLKISGVNDGSLAQALYGLKASFFKNGNSSLFTFSTMRMHYSSEMHFHYSFLVLNT